MNILSEAFAPDKNGNIEVELYGGPQDGLWIETAVPEGQASIVIDGHWRYIWDGEEPVNKFRYIQDLELEMAWVDAHSTYEEEE